MRILVIIILALSISSCGLFNKQQTTENIPIPETSVAETPVSGEILLVENYDQVNSFEDLLKPFRGKVVYVDIWATWCGPCKRELGFKDGLNNFVKDKNIELLYLSVDHGYQWEKWKNFITAKQMTGYHIQANEQLVADLREKFSSRESYGRKVLSLPTYIIVDKEGKVANKSAFRPSHKQLLYDQLSRVL